MWSERMQDLASILPKYSPPLPSPSSSFLWSDDEMAVLPVDEVLYAQSSPEIATYASQNECLSPQTCQDNHLIGWLGYKHHPMARLIHPLPKASSLTAQIHVYFGDVTWEQSHATTHIGQILLGVSHTHLDSAHTSALLTAQHMTHMRFTLVSATKLKHKHQTDLCATSIVNNETKTMHATQQYKVHDNIMRTI
jgi:hypothetical protein